MDKGAAAPLQTKAELAGLIERFTGKDGALTTAIPTLHFFRQTAPTEPQYCVFPPSLILVVQGAKQATLNDETYHYGPGNYLLNAVDLPVVCNVTKASPDEPYLSTSMVLNRPLMASLLSEPLPEPTWPDSHERGMSVTPLPASLQDAVIRLIRLLDSPQDIPMLYPLVEREILYRLLTGDQGHRLRRIAMTDSQPHQISRAIDWLRENFTSPLRIDDLARRVNMSSSSLHHHFKAITAMSPLQYQKQLRLQEARRLMLVHQLDAASASHQVGYESPSQFSREYSRLYGAPPRQDVMRLR
ncbi:MAG TPA: AraC family transcriptional regulator [Candidatus Sulfotelmatobacter sp.]|jgi:AraC-like DNA-binding protein|nr:AraC family transcriptional regulator [Candidatus Sulfotelmatobacter sp.]